MGVSEGIEILKLIGLIALFTIPPPLLYGYSKRWFKDDDELMEAN